MQARFALAIATLDQLPEEQRALLELLLARRRSYAGVAEILGLARDDVAGVAHSALRELSPASGDAVPPALREEVGDYVLGQLSGPSARAARERLARSPEARAWALSLLDSLDSLMEGEGRPEVPPPAEPEPEREPGDDDDEPSRPARARRSPPAWALAAGAAAAVVLVVVIVLLAGGGGDDGGKASTTASAGSTTPATGTTQGAIKAEEGGQFVPSKGEQASGTAGVYAQGTRRVLVVQAKLKPSTKSDAYEVWLYNSAADAQAMGAQSAGKSGVLQGQAAVASNYKRFRSVVISRERVGAVPKQPSAIVATAPLKPAG
jgi:anti-sigma-K factor RskA